MAGSSAFAAPAMHKGPISPKGPLSPHAGKTLPKAKPKPGIISAGLKSRVTLTPRALHQSGVSMDVHRAPRIETTNNKVPMDKHTQLWLHFRAEKRTEYDISCQFNGRRSILTMDYANGKYVRQQSTTPATNGRLHHKVYARSATENIKVFMQASGNVDWRSCTVEPAD